MATIVFIKNLLFADNHRKLRNLISGILYALSLLLLDIGFRFIYSEGVTLLLADYVTLFFSLACIAILTAISFLLPRLIRRIYQIASVSVFAIFAVVHAFFYSFNGTYLTISSVIFAGDAAAFFDWSYFTIPKKFILLVFIVLFLAVISALIIPITKYNWVRVISATLAIIAGFVGFALCKRTYLSEEGGLSWDSARMPVEIYESFSDSRTCLHMVGLIQYTFRDISNATGLTDLIETITSGDDLGKLDEYYANKQIDPDNEMTGIHEDKNLILIQLESIDSWMVNDVAMPFFAKLQREGINFTDFYAPKFMPASTFNTELIVNTGLITPMNSAKISYFTENYYPYSAANLFKDKGYLVESYHRSTGTIYNRGSAHTNWGYEKYNNGFAMNMENLDLDTHMMAAYDQFVKDDKFMSFIITYSGHGPYSPDRVEVKEYYDIIKPQLPSDAEEEYIYALCHAYETDQFIKMLVERLEADGKLEDTVLVFYADHYDHYISDQSILAKYKGNVYDSNLWSNIPFTIYHKGTSAMTVQKTVSSLDVLPTIVNLFNLNTDGRYYIGNDAFSQNGGYVFFQNNSWIEGDTYFNVDSSTPTELSKQRAKEIYDRLNMSLDTVKIDYFAKKSKSN